MKEAGFLNLSPKLSEGLDHKVYLNAKRLYRDAEVLCKNSSYSTATSLIILSSEEIIKALLILLHSKGFKVYQIKGAKKFFANHRVRHEIAELIEVGAGLYRLHEQWENESNNPVFRTRFKILNSILNGFHKLARMKEPFEEAKLRIESLEEFDALKNRGFYVDYQNELLIPEEKVTKEVYLNTKNTALNIFNYYKIFRVLLHCKAGNHISKKEIESLKSHLHGFINESLIKGDTYHFN